MNLKSSENTALKNNLVLLIISISAFFLNAAETLSVIPDSAQALATVGGRFANLNDASAVRVSPANILAIKSSELLINTAIWNGNVAEISKHHLFLKRTCGSEVMEGYIRINIEVEII